MTRFYICTTGVAKGPYQLNQLENLDIKANDLIWSDQYDNRRAGQVPEFKDYFKKQQQPFSRSVQKNRNSRHITLGFLLTLLVLMVIYYFTIVQ